MRKNIGFIGWRGMVGSVLMERMRAEGDFKGFSAHFFSTSQVGQPAPEEAGEETLKDGYSLDDLTKCDMIVTCQGGDYTKKMHPALRESGWKGEWIDAASALRMESNSVLILDPVNGQDILDSHHNGKRDFIGANCTVSLLLMGIAPLLKSGLVDWVTSMTYQAASGAGARNMLELLEQMGELSKAGQVPAESILETDQKVTEILQSDVFPTENFGAPLAGNVLPWIDTLVETGQSREEWKGMAETNKILNSAKPIPIDGTCVRVGAMRSHAQGLTIKLNKDIGLDEVEGILKDSHQWFTFVDNNKEETLQKLTPVFTSGTLNVSLGRLRKMNLGPQYLNAFTVGDQLLWGAAEPLRRVLKMLIEK